MRFCWYCLFLLSGVLSLEAKPLNLRQPSPISPQKNTRKFSSQKPSHHCEFSPAQPSRSRRGSRPKKIRPKKERTLPSQSPQWTAQTTLSHKPSASTERIIQSEPALVPLSQQIDLSEVGAEPSMERLHRFAFRRSHSKKKGLKRESLIDSQFSEQTG